jgi:hypothetical protein
MEKVALFDGRQVLWHVLRILIPSNLNIQRCYPSFMSLSSGKRQSLFVCF